MVLAEWVAGHADREGVEGDVLMGVTELGRRHGVHEGRLQVHPVLALQQTPTQQQEIRVY